MAIEFEDEQARLAYEEAVNRLNGNPQMDDVDAMLLFQAYPLAVQIARVVVFREGLEELLMVITRKMLVPGDMTGIPRMQVNNYLNVLSMVMIIEDAGTNAFLARQEVIDEVIKAHIASGEPLDYTEELEEKLREPLIPGWKARKQRNYRQVPFLAGWEDSPDAADPDAASDQTDSGDQGAWVGADGVALLYIRSRRRIAPPANSQRAAKSVALFYARKKSRPGGGLTLFTAHSIEALTSPIRAMRSIGFAAELPMPPPRNVLDHLIAVATPALQLFPRTYLAELRTDFRRRGLQRAVRKHDTAALFDWLMDLAAQQGISDANACAFIDRHGNVTYAEIEAALASGPSCGRLRSYWSFHGCGYRKGTRTCAEPRLLPSCPLPTHELRKGGLNQAAYSLFLFVRDVCDGDFVGWMDARLAGADPGVGIEGRGRSMMNVLLEPLRNVYGMSDKLWSMALANLLLGGDPNRERWVAAGASMIAVDTLVHNFLVRTGVLRRANAEHPYGPACYSRGGCADLVEAAAMRIDARAFHPDNPAHGGRRVERVRNPPPGDDDRLRSLRDLQPTSALGYSLHMQDGDPKIPQLSGSNGRTTKHVKRAHHVIVFVFQDMAVEHVLLRLGYPGWQFETRAYPGHNCWICRQPYP